MIGVLQTLKFEHDRILLNQLIFKSNFFLLKKKKTFKDVVPLPLKSKWQ